MQQPDLVHCLQCDNVFEEGEHFVEVCPFCDNDNLGLTVYIQPEDIEQYVCTYSQRR
jgi:Zn finger protein HypA/HybF involved in hydrogenase expression